MKGIVVLQGKKYLLDIEWTGHEGDTNNATFCRVAMFHIWNTTAVRPICNTCELKRTRLAHFMANTRYYSPSAAVAAWSCGGPDGSDSLVPRATAAHIDRLVLMWPHGVLGDLRRHWTPPSHKWLSIQILQKLFYPMLRWRQTRNALTIVRQNCWKAATFKNKMMMEEQYKDLRNKLWEN
jgi:hypothetical protein